jgi:tRNA(fMet)-specific endonuclease VapC
MKRFILDAGIAAFEYGRLAFELKTSGRPIGQNDIMIAAIGKSLRKKALVK